MAIQLKRIYEEPTKNDGFRVLVDRLWPRGISTEEAQLDLWLKDVAPSTELRKWFDHDPKKWKEFQRRYANELSNSEAFDTLKTIIKKQKVVTLLYGARDTEHNGAIVLKKQLLQ